MKIWKCPYRKGGCPYKIVQKTSDGYFVAVCQAPGCTRIIEVHGDFKAIKGKRPQEQDGGGEDA